jgi:hypothetical protein
MKQVCADIVAEAALKKWTARSLFHATIRYAGRMRSNWQTGIEKGERKRL